MLIATRNLHKVGEIQAILGAGFEMLTLKDFPEAPKVVEDAETFAGNARKKAEQLARWLETNPAQLSRHPALAYVLADDSGLEVDALGGAPGVYSARFAVPGNHENSSDAENNAKLLRLLKDVAPEKRSARFHCVVALAPIVTPDLSPANASPVCYAGVSASETLVFDGVCEGKIIQAGSGKGGFGYDPLFVPTGFAQTFAELGDEIKNQLSHRAKALAKLKHYFSKLAI
jgi:XTP/dITP diphosphohydrolase